jgi:hypothetical protein
MTEPESCDRCGREISAAEYSSCEAIIHDDGSVGVVCEGCVTGTEEQAAFEDWATMDTSMGVSMRACARCGRSAPDFAAGSPESPSYGDPVSQGWYFVEEGLACAACATPDEMDDAAAHLEAGMRWVRWLSGEKEGN